MLASRVITHEYLLFMYAVEWADLPIVDFTSVHTPEGRAVLAPQMHDAMRTHGFLYIVNHGLTQPQVCDPLSCSRTHPGHILIMRTAAV